MNDCINIGTGPGFFEHRVKRRLNIEIPSADLEFTEGYDIIKEQLNVTNHTMDNIWSKDFQIDGCIKVYNNALLMRFVPLNENCDSGSKLHTIVDNIGKYANNIISIEYVNNFKDGSMERWLMKHLIDTVEGYNVYHINVEKAKKSLRNYITQK